MKGLRNIMLIVLLAGSAAMYSGCSSGPSADDLAQLDQLKSRYDQLEIFPIKLL